MKVYKEIVAKARKLDTYDTAEQEQILWELLCYAPKMPLRKNQEDLLAQADHEQMQVEDIYFSGKTLDFNVFKWGKGPKLIFITHGWSSKAADFSSVIQLLLEIEGITLIAFDAPGNGSSAAGLSNLLLYTEALKALFNKYGSPFIQIGHSLGAMANMMALEEAGLKPDLLISIAPVINLKALFSKMMQAVDVRPASVNRFFEIFFERFQQPASAYNLMNYKLEAASHDHWIAYDDQDAVVDTTYLQEFLQKHPGIQHSLYTGVGHEKLIRQEDVIQEVLTRIKARLNNPS